MLKDITSFSIPQNPKLLCYNVDPSSGGPIYLNNQSISIVSHDKHLVNYISTDIHAQI